MGVLCFFRKKTQHPHTLQVHSQPKFRKYGPASNCPKEVLINLTKLVIAPKGHKRAKRGNLTVHNQSLGDCFVTALLAMTN
jgi:hypothetical protein